MRRVLLLCLLLLPCLQISPARAADPCPLLRAQTQSPAVAQRIAAYACMENQNWYRTFIDADGRVYGPRTYEAENSGLADGMEAWRHVAMYWTESGLLSSAYGRAGASECAYAATSRYPSPGCRAFIIDTPWSAAFVSWVMRRAGLPGFNGSASHIHYVRDAYRKPAESAYQVQDPRAGKPALGDMLCSVRSSSRMYGFGDLATLLSLPDNAGLAMHCDIVVGATPSGIAYLVGGNVQQSVTLRMLRLAPNGYFANLPTRTLADPQCSPDQPANCDANRSSWAVLLKLRPAEELATLPQPYVPLQPTPSAPGQQPAQQCCVNCVMGSGIPRCPAGTAPAQTSPQAPTRAPVRPATPAMNAPSLRPPAPGQQCCVNCQVGANIPRCPAGTAPPPRIP